MKFFNVGYSSEFSGYCVPQSSIALMNGDKKVFPNATVYVSKKELDYWLSEDNYAHAPARLKKYFDEARLKVTLYVNIYHKVITNIAIYRGGCYFPCNHWNEVVSAARIAGPDFTGLNINFNMPVARGDTFSSEW